ncbi:MaoC family dehydratase [Gordonia rubripertincta]|uniref:MaoC family dehydratase n=1 Tax=Gordonia rubripertincta TaxID=36822 RepID=A0ABT4MWQ7_GORRU|nr:MaoC family dehydratase [Gordonia rubripertincta]MCZ4551442.1 MaoC family dehydratase [Gordonia rubripertincta]
MTAGPNEHVLRWSVEEVDGQRMKTLALLLGDPNPIHLAGVEAERLGLGTQPVNQGPSTMAMIYNMFEARCPGSRVRRMKVRLLGNVVAGQKIVVTGRSVDEVSGGNAAYDVEVTADGTVVIAGRAELEIKREGGA